MRDAEEAAARAPFADETAQIALHEAFVEIFLAARIKRVIAAEAIHGDAPAGTFDGVVECIVDIAIGAVPAIGGEKALFHAGEDVQAFTRDIVHVEPGHDAPAQFHPFAGMADGPAIILGITDEATMNLRPCFATASPANAQMALVSSRRP